MKTLNMSNELMDLLADMRRRHVELEQRVLDGGELYSRIIEETGADFEISLDDGDLNLRGVATEEGRERLIDFLKSCGLETMSDVRPEGLFGFWYPAGSYGERNMGGPRIYVSLRLEEELSREDIQIHTIESPKQLHNLIASALGEELLP